MYKGKKETRPSRLDLDRKLFIRRRGETDAEHNGRMVNELKIFIFRGRSDLVREFAEHSRLPERFIPIYRGGLRFHKVVNVVEELTADGYADWILALFSTNRALLEDFCKVKSTVSGAILNFNPSAALECLDNLNEQCASWWAIEKSIHIQKELRGIDAKAAIKNVVENNPKLNIAGITQDLLLLSESASIDYFINAVLSRLREYKISGIQSVISHGMGESIRSLPLAYDADRQPTLRTMAAYSSFSLIDQYCLFRSIFIEQLARGAVDRPELLTSVAELAASINDQELISLIDPPLDLDPFVNQIMIDYTNGKYELVQDKIRGCLTKNPVKCFGLIELYARCKVYTGSTDSGEAFYDRLANEYSKILRLDFKSGESQAYLEKIAVKFKDEGWAKSLLFHVFSLRKWGVDQKIIEGARLSTLTLGKYNTPRAHDKDHRVDLNLTAHGNIVPNERRIRYESASSDIPDSTHFTILSDYLKIQAQLYLDQKRYREAIDFCVGKCLANPVAFSHLPIGPLCDTLPDLHYDARDDYVSALLLYDIYSKNGDSRYEENKSDLFENFLEFGENHKPSEIFADEDLDERVSSFLHYVCVPAQLDNVIDYLSNDEVVLERVAIIDLLIAAKASGFEALRLEKDRVVENLFAEKLRAKIESGKLFVDVQALAAHRRQLYASLYEQARALEGGLQLAPLTKDSQEIDSTDVLQVHARERLVVAASEKSGLLAKIYFQAAQDFALNENYGLEKYLSAEVRHVVFQTQLRACFEKSRLVTVVKDGHYISNNYWLQRYNTYVAEPVMERLDEILGDFSRRIDAILFAINEQFRVHFLTDDTTGIFDFSPYHRRLVRLASIINESTSFEVFFRNLIAFMWELAGDGARAAQRLINGRLVLEVGSAIDELESDLSEARGPVAMFELVEAIKTAKSNFTKEVEVVLNWFRFVGAENVDAQERLSVVVEAAVSSFESMFRHKGKRLAFEQEVSALPLKYSEARALFISLFTALENALKYGEGDQPVRITHKTEKPLECIVISNAIGNDFGDPVAFISNEKNKWSEENSKLSIVEGGSGLYKIHNLLTNASPGFSFDISVYENIFSASISLRHEIFNHRRQFAQT